MAKQETITNPIVFDILERPLVTEKSTVAGSLNKVTFKVDLKATKPQIKLAVEQLFSVKVKSVNTILVQGKQKMFRGRPGRRSDFKKAVVTLAEGSSIEAMGGI